MSADMRRMAEAFNTNVTALEDELMQLILEGQIQARIDSHNKVRKLFFVLALNVRLATL
jgi:COP9 signalosome complex subunit 1